MRFYLGVPCFTDLGPPQLEVFDEHARPTSRLVLERLPVHCYLVLEDFSLIVLDEHGSHLRGTLLDDLTDKVDLGEAPLAVLVFSANSRLDQVIDLEFCIFFHREHRHSAASFYELDGLYCLGPGGTSCCFGEVRGSCWWCGCGCWLLRSSSGSSGSSPSRSSSVVPPPSLLSSRDARPPPPSPPRRLLCRFIHCHYRGRPLSQRFGFHSLLARLFIDDEFLRAALFYC